MRISPARKRNCGRPQNLEDSKPRHVATRHVAVRIVLAAGIGPRFGRGLLADSRTATGKAAAICQLYIGQQSEIGFLHVPPTVDGSTSFTFVGGQVSGLAFDGSSVWVAASPNIVKVNDQTFNVTQVIPEPGEMRAETGLWGRLIRAIFAYSSVGVPRMERHEETITFFY